MNPMGESKLEKLRIEKGRDNMGSNGGLAIAGAIIHRHKIGAKADHIRIGKGKPDISNSDVLKSYLGLLAMGRTTFSAIELYRNDGIFRVTLGIKSVPSEGTLRQRFDDAKGAFDTLIVEFNHALLSAANLTPVLTEKGLLIPVDADVSVFANPGCHKENIGRTYAGCDGYSPMFAYIGLEGFMLGCELRPGVQHCQNGTPAFLRMLVDRLKALNSLYRYLFRLDSGNDAADNLMVLHGYADYIIKRNLRKEQLEEWLNTARKHGEAKNPRPGKTVWTGSIKRTVSGIGEIRIVFEVIERTIKFNRKGGVYQQLLIPDIEVATFWTSLEDSADSIIELYHQHGTSEQFHSELKTDMDVEKLPSGKFTTNSTVLQMAMLAYNILRTIGTELIRNAKDLPMKLDITRRRLRSVIMDIIMAGCKLVYHSRTYRLKTGISYAWFEPFRRLYLKFST